MLQLELQFKNKIYEVFLFFFIILFIIIFILNLLSIFSVCIIYNDSTGARDFLITISLITPSRTITYFKRRIVEIINKKMYFLVKTEALKKISYALPM